MLKGFIKFRPWVVGGLLFLLAGLGVGGLLSKLYWVGEKEPVARDNPIDADNIPKQIAKPPVDLSTLAERMSSGVLPLTPEQILEQKRIQNEQVEEASKALNHIDPVERLAGAEQLAAYPTSAAERSLVTALETDLEAEVRRAAAVSLGYVKKPKKGTIQVLLMAVTDSSEEVRSAAMETLTRYFAHDDPDSARSKQIIRGLETLGKSKDTPPDIREDIRDWLRDQTAN